MHARAAAPALTALMSCPSNYDSTEDFDRGALGLFGQRLRLHWTVALTPWLLGGMAWHRAALVAFVALSLTKALGHHVMARRLGKSVRAWRFSALGGDIVWGPETAPAERSRVALGGQVALFIAWLLARWAAEDADLGLSHLAAVTALARAARLAAFAHFLPFFPLEGWETWQWPFRAASRWSVETTRTRLAAQRRQGPTAAPADQAPAAASPEPPSDHDAAVEALVAEPPEAVQSVVKDLWAQARRGTSSDP